MCTNAIFLFPIVFNKVYLHHWLYYNILLYWNKVHLYHWLYSDILLCWNKVQMHH